MMNKKIISMVFNFKMDLFAYIDYKNSEKRVKHDNHCLEISYKWQKEIFPFLEKFKCDSQTIDTGNSVQKKYNDLFDEIFKLQKKIEFMQSNNPDIYKKIIPKRQKELEKLKKEIEFCIPNIVLAKDNLAGKFEKEIKLPKANSFLFKALKSEADKVIVNKRSIDANLPDIYSYILTVLLLSFLKEFDEEDSYKFLIITSQKHGYSKDDFNKHALNIGKDRNQIYYYFDNVLNKTQARRNLNGVGTCFFAFLNCYSNSCENDDYIDKLQIFSFYPKNKN